MKKPRTITLFALCFAIVGPGATRGGGSKTVTVDCSKGDSINAALENTVAELIIEISGVCNERVIIRREGVVLRGANQDPDLDGLVGPSGEPGATAILEVWNVDFGVEISKRAVTIENLSISGSENIGLFAAGSSLQLDNCRLVDNAGRGAHFTKGSFATILNTAFAGNGGAGIQVQRNALISCLQCSIDDNASSGIRALSGGQGYCESCTFSGNGNWAVDSTNGGWARLDHSEISGENGLRSFEESQVYGWYNTVNVTGTALLSTEASQLQLVGGNLTGRIQATLKSLVWLGLVAQLDSLGGNLVADDSTLVLDYGTSLDGTTAFDTFSNGQIRNDSSLGELDCTNGADVFCDGSETKTSSNCGLCPPVD